MGMPKAGSAHSSNAYEPRHADEAVVYRVVAAELDGFLAAAEERGHPLPSFVATTLRDFLTCGIPEHGFLRVRCDRCGRDRVVAFSCKRRGVCGSCGGRRMAETAANLVDGVLPEVPMRQWVLSLPFPLRYRLAYDRTLATPLLAAFLRAVFASLRRRARECYGANKAKCGAVTFLQRFGGALNLSRCALYLPLSSPRDHWKNCCCVSDVSASTTRPVRLSSARMARTRSLSRSARRISHGANGTI